MNRKNYLKDIAHPSSISNSKKLANSPGNPTISVGSEPAAWTCIVNQPYCTVMRVSNRGTEVPECLLKGMEAIQIDQIKINMV